MTTNRKPSWQLIPGDWVQLSRIINELGNVVIQTSQPLWDLTLGNTSLHSGSLVLPGLSGILKATAGVVSGSAQHSDLGGVTANQHHNQVHVLDGSDHTVSGLTPGDVLQALTSTTFGFAAVPGLHSAVTLATSADVLLGLTGQQLSLDTQAATYVLAGPVSGAAAAPTFRALAATDIPALAYQASNANLTAIAGLSVTDSNIIVGDGATWVAESGATARTSLGLGTTNKPTLAGVDIVSASDAAPVSIDNDATNFNITLTCYNAASTAPGFLGRKARGSKASPGYTLDNDYLLAVSGRGYCNSGGFPASVSPITLALRCSQDHTDTAMGTHFRFETTANGSTSRLCRMVLSNSGYLGVGFTSDSGITEMVHSTAKVRADSVFNCNGTDGVTANVAVAKVGGGTRTLNFAGGIYTGYTDS